ncbi:hypothetical protein EAG_15529 [Camponotus floridanus]|uniref:Uncharacterized protein n=1 Tax=Camponotus floridanus TaxID=104421 RepID=E2AZK7_CAMFO|nr:hypothetical protein EAG_15529 [Camponotus floridanus]
MRNGHLCLDAYAAVFVLMRCRPMESHLTLVLGGDYNEFLVQSYFDMIPVMLIDETYPRFDVLQNFTLTRYFYLMFKNYNFIHLLRKAHRFVLVISSQSLLRALLQIPELMVRTRRRYQIRLNALEHLPFIKINLSLPKQEIFRGDNSEIVKIFLNKLNASLEITIFHNDDIYSLSGIGPNGTFEGLMAPVTDNRIDIAMNARPMLTLWKIKHTYPHIKSGICVIAQPKKPISEFIKIVTFLSPGVMVFNLMRCIPIKSHLTLVLGGDCNEFLVQSHINMIPVALIDERNPRVDVLQKFILTKYSYQMFKNYNFNHFLRKAHRFVLVTSSQPLLRALLQKAKDSPWANPEGFYILVDKQTKTRGCINARSYLWTAWKYDLLSVIFICIDPDDGIVLYTFNPYSNSSPDNWNEVGHVKGRAGHPWIILKRKFISDSDICIDLNFDKTITLNRYKIRLNAIDMKPYIKINLSLPKQERVNGDNSKIIKTLLNKLNASLEITIPHRDVYSLGGIGPNGTYDGAMAPVSDRRTDIIMNARSLFVLWKIRYTYPHIRGGVCVIAQPKKPISEIIKIITFLSPEVIVGIIGTCVLIYIIFMKNVGYMKAGLEVIRLVISAGFLHLPKIDSARIFISMALILFLNINALFQSHLSSLLTVPVYYRDIDSIQSLKDAGYTLYGPKNFKPEIGDSVLQSRYKIVTYKDCKEHVENSSTAICVGDCHHLYYRIKDQDLIKSKMLFPLLRSYVTRENWPLYNRVNDIIDWMVQAGLIKKAQDEILWEIQHEEERRIALTKKNFNIMSLKQLTFSFYILGLGYAFAIIIFVLEMAIGGSIPVCQNKNVIGKKKKKNSMKKNLE